MNRLHIFAVIGSMLISIVSTVTMLVFCLAAMANANADSIHRLKTWMMSLSMLSLLCLAVAGWLLYDKRPGWASAGIALAPTVLMGTIFIYKVTR